MHTGRKLLLGYLLTVGLILGVAVHTLGQSRAALDAAHFVAHSHEVTRAVAQVESQLYRAEALLRAYLLSDRPDFLEEYRQVWSQLDLTVQTLVNLTADNPAQQRLLPLLRAKLAERGALFTALLEARERGGMAVIRARFAQTQRVSQHVLPTLQALMVEEKRLLAVREMAEARRTEQAIALFLIFVLGVLALISALFWFTLRDLRTRQRLERETAAQAHDDDSHARLLTLYNHARSVREALEGTLTLLAERHGFAVSAYYAVAPLGDALIPLARHAAPISLAASVRLGEGLLGQVARDGRPQVLDGAGLSRVDADLRFDTGLGALPPATLVYWPVLHQDKVQGVLLLAASRPLDDRDRVFLERVVGKLAVALHNLRQFEDLQALAEELRRRGAEIERKNAQLEEASRMKSEFLANMSHELRTPLNAIIGFAEVLRDGLAGPLSDSQQTYIGQVHDSGRHLLTLINDILDLSKVEAGRMDLELVPTTLPSLLDGALTMVREKGLKHHIHLDSACEGDCDAPILVDARRVKQILYNLLSNAVKFTPDGGVVRLGLKRVTRAAVEAACASGAGRCFRPQAWQGDFAEFCVADTGVGIAAADLQRLFQPFVQLDSGLNRQHSGTGLGLVMVLRLAQLHDGGLYVESTPGQGSRFTIWLPWREPGSSMPQEPAAAVAILPDQIGTVLLVEDDPEARDLLRAQLEAAGYAVQACPSAEAAPAAIAARRPGAIVLDILLPGLDGWQYLAQIKADPATADIPVVIVSVTDEARHGLALGAAQVLVKPVQRADLLAALDSLKLPEQHGPVLVVDDDPAAVSLISTLLRGAGFEPLGAYGGREGVALARAHPPALIVLDLLMPDMSGFEVVEALRETPQTASVPVLVLTALSLTDTERQELRQRVRGVVEKSSFDGATFQAEVRRALAARTRK